MPMELKMLPEEFAELRAQAAAISLQDVHLGRFLTNLLGHLGHAHGLDAATEDARLAAEARKKARDEEDAALKTATEDRAKTRVLEDSQTLLPAQRTARDAARAIEDAQLKEDAEALQKKRDDEDAATKTSGENAPSSAQQPAANPASKPAKGA